MAGQGKHDPNELLKRVDDLYKNLSDIEKQLFYAYLNPYANIRKLFDDLRARRDRLEELRKYIRDPEREPVFGPEPDEIANELNSIGQFVQGMTYSIDGLKHRDNYSGGAGGGNRGKSGSGQGGGDDGEGTNSGRREGKGGRFWEEYAVRYVGGMFVGSVCFVALFHFNQGGMNQLLEPFQDMLEHLMHNDSVTALVTIIIGVGFTFSYIASAPIYVMHLFRRFFIMMPGIPKKLGGYIASHWLLACAFLPILYIGGVGAEMYYIHATAGRTPSIFDWMVSLGFLSIIALQLIPIVRYLGEPLITRSLADYYKRLALSRADRSYKGGVVVEYVESYRHLREHGNAFLVIIANFVLAAILSVAPTVESLVTLVILWLLPATIGWFAATMLESQLQEQYWAGPPD
jgi:hypothetical protein